MEWLRGILDGIGNYLINNPSLLAFWLIGIGITAFLALFLRGGKR